MTGPRCARDSHCVLCEASGCFPAEYVFYGMPAKGMFPGHVLNCLSQALPIDPPLEAPGVATVISNAVQVLSKHPPTPGTPETTDAENQVGWVSEAYDVAHATRPVLVHVSTQISAMATRTGIKANSAMELNLRLGVINIIRFNHKLWQVQEFSGANVYIRDSTD